MNRLKYERTFFFFIFDNLGYSDCLFQVGLNEIVNVQSISIYETYHAGAVVKVSLRDPHGNWVPVWRGQAQNIQQSRIFQPPLQVQDTRDDVMI